MKKLLTVAIVSLAALGLCAERASAFYLLKHLCCCGHQYKVTCRPYNAFSPPCCFPCFGMAPFAYPGCQGCQTACGPNGCGAPIADYPVGPSMPSAAPGQMPPATAAPQYMPPAPAEAEGGGQARMMPTMPMWGGMGAQNVMYSPMAMGGYYPPMMQQPMMGQPMMQGQMLPPQMMQPQMLPQQVIQQGYYGR